MQSGSGNSKEAYWCKGEGLKGSFSGKAMHLLKA